MIVELISYIQTIITQYGAGGIFFATILEEVIAPIPSPLVSLAGGFFLLSHNILWLPTLQDAFILIAIPVAIGVSLGSTAVYALGYFGGKPILEKWGKWLGLQWDEVEKTKKKLTLKKGDEVVLFGLRLLPLVPGVAISGFCGIVRYRFFNFIIVTFFGSLCRAFILALIGWRVGELYQKYVVIIDHIEQYVFLAILVAVVIGGIFWYRRRRSTLSS